MNATRHAVLSVVPVLPGVERAEDWEAHRSATSASLVPRGYLETVLADRVASLLWRLGRVTRYETENTTSELETADDDVAESLRFEAACTPGRLGRMPVAFTQAQLQEEVEMATENVRAFVTLRELEGDDAFPPTLAETVLYEVAVKAEVELEEVCFPFVPAEAVDVGLGQWHGWTKKLVLEAVAVVASASAKDHVADGEQLWRATGALAEAAMGEAVGALRETEAKLRRSVRSRLLLPDGGLEKVARYETHLERSLYKALHELQRLQALRDGTGGPPCAVDVDVSVGPGASKAAVVAIGEIVKP